MLKGFSNGPGFEEGKTFQTISEFLIYQLGSHGQDWGHLLVPYGYEPEGIQIPVNEIDSYHEFKKKKC